MTPDFLTTPFRFREVGDGLLVTNEVGDFRFFDSDFPERFFQDELSAEETRKLEELSITVNEQTKWRLYSLLRRINQKKPGPRRIHYLILVPTLRCDLTCSYCQVSRAPLNAKGFDWGADQLEDYERFIAGLDLDHVKVEFQGGEPSLRSDLLKKIIEITKRHSRSAEFVACSNLTKISSDFADLLGRDDFVVSTSIDGDVAAMTQNRTQDDSLSRTVLENIRWVLNNYGPHKLSALPTITENQIHDPRGLVRFYESFGFQGIFLRPVNFMGFARKKHKTLTREIQTWNSFYAEAIDEILEINKTNYFEEFYLAVVLRGIFGREKTGFVDFRSPSNFLGDYCVVDFDGRLYPSDEARMLSRIGHVDLSLGDMRSGFDEQGADELNYSAMNQTNPDCIHCAYLPYCGIDIVDDLSRYHRMDVPKAETWFCNRQMFIFDWIFEKVKSGDRKWLDLFLKWIARTEEPRQCYEVFL